MAYFDDFDQAKKHSQAAHDLLQGHGIPATPSNYEVSYCYTASLNPELKSEIDALIDSGKSLTTDIVADLYARFCADGASSDTLGRATASIEEQITKVLGLIDNSATDTQEYSESLKNYGESLTGPDAGAELKKVLSAVLDDTKKMQAKTQALNSELSASSEQINQLRADLEDVTRESRTDPLTGLSNRKVFDEQMIKQSEASESNDRPLSLIFGDVDHFKKVNDNWGHQLGDQVLKLIANILQANVDEGVTVARYGGEEFGVVLPNTPLDRAVRLADKMRELVASKQVKKKSSGESIGRITMSFGVTEFNPGEPVSDFIQRADTCLYAAKDSGRNQVAADRAASDHKDEDASADDAKLAG